MCSWRFGTLQARAKAIGGPSACSSARNEAARVVRDHTADHGETPSANGRSRPGVSRVGRIASGSSPLLVQLIGNDWFRRYLALRRGIREGRQSTPDAV